MQDLFEMDWSFIFVIVGVTVLMVTLAVRSRILKRQRQREEKLHAKRQYKEWLSSSHMQPLDMDENKPDKR